MTEWSNATQMVDRERKEEHIATDEVREDIGTTGSKLACFCRRGPGLQILSVKCSPGRNGNPAHRVRVGCGILFPLRSIRTHLRTKT